MRRGKLWLGGLAISASIMACKTINNNGAKTLNASDSDRSSNLSLNREKPALCAGVRGNGQLITAHWHSLARIMEMHGALEGMAGGSSASITAFLYESMNANTSLMDCQGGDQKACAMERGQKLALGMKSLFGVLDAISETDDILALRDLVRIDAEIKKSFEDKGKIKTVWGLMKDDTLAEAATRIKQILTSSKLKSLISDQVWQTLDLGEISRSPRKSLGKLKDLYASLTSISSFKADSPTIFLRTPIINFNRLSSLIGRAGDFYAERGQGYPKDVMDAFYRSCTQGTQAQPWPAIAAKALTLPDNNSLKLPSTSTCGNAFRAAFLQYWNNYDATQNTIATRRINEPVGKYLPLLISTSILEGDRANQALAQARQNYANTGTSALAVDFRDVYFGYWGQQNELDRVATNIKNQAIQNSENFKAEGEARHEVDAKSAKFLALGPQTWDQALRSSPAEPGLSPIVDLVPGKRASAGGWSDLHPTLVLRNLGCEKVVYVTRQGVESGFAQGVAGLLGMNRDTDGKALFNTTDGNGDDESSFLFSMRMADGIWCTNWNAFKATQIKEIVADSLQAPYYVRPSLAQGQDLKGTRRMDFQQWRQCLAEPQ